MAQITLTIRGDATQATQIVEQLKTSLRSISSIPIDVTSVNSLDTALQNAARSANDVSANSTKYVSAQARLVSAQARLKSAENAVAVEREKTQQATERRIKSENQLATQTERTAAADDRAKKSTTGLQNSLQQTTAKTNSLGAAQGDAAEKTKTFGTEQETAAKKSTLLNNAIKFTQWYLLGGAISSAIRSVKDAISAMQDVDDELVVIRKVTGATGAELEKIEEQAYSTASKYGVAASEYLESVAAFSRAGYGDLASTLAELSTKTQIVGDTDAETANQFLLSMDAAYQYKGSVEQLSRVLDGANEIDNKYATSIEKIAEGLGKVAPVAAQAHVTEAELTAAIGTITAVTQRSGTEAATALRALMLNIIGDTKTEIDEGVTWTTGEIAGLTDVIKKYAPEAYKAAEATGSVIDPMEAIGGLAQAMQEGLLTEQELMEQVSDIGGKLRTSQLLALIQNWDMYQSMLADYGNAVGSADAEVENALDSWTRKTEILKNTWTEFINNSISSDFFKWLLDAATAAIDFADNIGLAATAIGGLVVAFKMFSAVRKANIALAAEEKAAQEMLAAAITAETTARNASAAAAKSWLGVAALVVSAISLAVMGYKQYQQEQEEARQASIESAKSHLDEVDAIEELREQYVSLQTDLESGAITEAEYNASLASIKDTLIQKYGLEKEAVEQLNASRKEGIALLDAEAENKAKQAWVEIVDEYQEAVEKLNGTRTLNETNSVVISDRILSDSQGMLNTLKDLGIAVDVYMATTNDQAMRVSASFGSAQEAATAYADAIIAVRNEMEKSDQHASAYNYLLMVLTGAYEQVTGDIDKYGEALDAGAAAYANYIYYESGANEITVKNSDSLDQVRGMMLACSDGTKENTDAILAYVDALFPLIDATDDESESLETLQENLEGATTAVEEFQNKIKDGEKGDLFADYADIYKTILERFQAGQFGAVDYRSGIEAFMPPEVLRSLGYDYEEAGKMLATDFWQAVFAEGGEDYGQNFITMLYEMGEGAEELGVHFEDLGDGYLNVIIDDFGQLAEGLGVSKDLILAITDALGIFGTALPETDDGVIDFARNLDALSGSAQGAHVNISKLVEGMVEAGYSDADIASIVDRLREIDDITLIEPEAGLQSVIDSARGVQDATDDAGDALEDLSSETAEPSVLLDTDLFDAGIRKIKNTLAVLSRTATAIRIGAEIGASASGTDSSPGGATLVNEEGAEIIQEGNTARIAGGGKPTITYLKPGARVFTAEQTKKILAGKSWPGDISAAAGGIYQIPIGSSTGGSASGSSGAGGSTSASSTTSTSSGGDALENLKKIVSLRESELDLLEAQGASTDKQIAKIAQIRSALMDQIRYMESIGEDQEEINKLTAKWYDWNEDILDLQKDLWDELEDAIDSILDREKDVRDAKIDALDAEIDAIKSAAEEEDKALDLEEKRLAVEEARAKLAEAEQDRTVRYFNAATGQWEWGANASNVKSAKDSLENAEEALREYEANLAQEAAIAEIEAKKDAINAAYDTLEANWNAVIDSMQEPAKDIGTILKEIASVQTPEMQAQIQTVSGLLAKLGYSIGAATNSGGSASGKPAAGASGSSVAGGSASVDAVARDVILGKYGNGSARMSALQAAGYDYNAVQSRVNEMLRSGIYDSGGILRGIGGIKATVRDEMVLPPDLTEKLISPMAGATVRERFAELGWLYGADRGSSAISGFVGRDTIGTQNNYSGALYQLGGVTLTEQQARMTSVFELAQLSRALSIYNRPM